MKMAWEDYLATTQALENKTSENGHISSIDEIRARYDQLVRKDLLPEYHEPGPENTIYPGMTPENVIYSGAEHEDVAKDEDAAEHEDVADQRKLEKPHLYTYRHDLERAYITNLEPWGKEATESAVFRKRTGEKEIAFVDVGKRIDIVDWQNEKTVLDALTLAQEKWGKCIVQGSEQYKQLCASVAKKHNINLINPELQSEVKEKSAVKEPFTRRVGHAISALGQNIKGFASRILGRDVKEINKEQLPPKEQERKEFTKKMEAGAERASQGHDPQKVKDLRETLKSIADRLESQTGQAVEDIKKITTQLEESCLFDGKIIREPLATSSHKGTIAAIDDTHIIQNVSSKSVMRYDKACIEGIDTTTLKAGDYVNINYSNGKATIRQLVKEKEKEISR